MRVWLVLCLLLGCGSSSEPAPAPPEVESPAPPSEPTPPAVVPPAAPAIPAAQVEALIARWVQAQNQGDFAAYEALYASRFSGTRRSGDSTRTFDREGFLEDRRRMFQRPMQVTSGDLVVHSTDTTAEAVFTQTWSSPTYSDQGPKRMVLVLENGELRISVEEMLASHRLGELDQALALGAFVAFETQRGTLALIAEASEQEATGAATLVRRDDPMVIAKDAAPSVNRMLGELVGRNVAVIANGHVCPGAVTSVQVARLVVPHFSARAGWSGEEGTPPASPERIATEAWGMGSRTYYAMLVAGPCPGAMAVTFAPSTSVPFARREASADERSTLFTRFVGTRAFTAYERSYREYAASVEPADAPPPPAQRASWATEANVAIYEHEGRHIGVVSHASPGCGGYGGAAWANFELNAAQIPAADGVGTDVRVLGVFDAEGDGTLEAVVQLELSSYGLVRLTPETRLLRRVDVDFLDCGC